MSTLITHLKMVRRLTVVVCLIAAEISASEAIVAKDTSKNWQAGFSKIDITPKSPVRLSGYGNRDKPHEGVETNLYVRAIALKHTATSKPHVLVSIDAIGIPGELSRSIASQLESELELPRSHVVFCTTHTHCAPDITGGLTNLFATPLGTVERQNGVAYKSLFEEAVLNAVRQCIETMAPATLQFTQGSTNFAANRRVIKDGKYIGFGVSNDGSADHAVPLLCIRDQDERVRGIIFNYACHCTTLGGEYNQIHSDWAGMACEKLETLHPDSIAVCTIGCGADANPEPRGAPEFAKQHAEKITDEVERLLGTTMRTIDQHVVSQFDYAGLAFELPTRSELKLRLEAEGTPQTKRNAQYLLDVYERDGRLPATYPVPIQTWKFGSQLSMIFLGGEVVSEYALRLKRELNDPQLWVSAYANDVPGYICSQRIREEGGYEFDYSAIFYNLPGPWESGTEDLFIQRIKEVLASDVINGARSPEESLSSIVVPEELRIELVASEPLVEDPINIAFGHDGKLWVVEMGDYPNGGSDGTALGKIKYLTDTNADGSFDTATTFLQNVSFPTGVHPWRNGVIITAAPDIVFAEDVTGDGKADNITKICTGFELANPQHRINGFAYGLDHSLHLASGDNLGEINCLKTNEKLNASGCDLKLFPDSGKLEVVSGRSQYIRSRNDSGDWFGSDNSRPMFHYPVEERYIRRVAELRIDANSQQLFDPPIAPPVFPRSKTVERFNDLFASNRFTSACSSIIFRSDKLGADRNGSAFICEPVHNLVHNARIQPNGASYVAERFESEMDHEFLASTDPWFRPVRAIEGPDGMLWIVDMYRQTIEHPEWIPEAWQGQLDLRAGSNRGRIYRVIPRDYPTFADASSWPRIKDAQTAILPSSFAVSCGTYRDMVQQELLTRDDRDSTIAELHRGITHQNELGRLHCLWCLHALGAVAPADVQAILNDPTPALMKNLLLVIEDIKLPVELTNQVLSRSLEMQDPKVDLQLSLTLGELAEQMDEPDEQQFQILTTLLSRERSDAWLDQGILTATKPHIEELLMYCLRKPDQPDSYSAIRRLEIADDLIAMVSVSSAASTLTRALEEAKFDFAHSRYLARLCFNAGLLYRDVAEVNELKAALQSFHALAIEYLWNAEYDLEGRIETIVFLCRGISDDASDRRFLLTRLSPQEPNDLQLAIIEQLCKSYDDATMLSLLDHWSQHTGAIRQRVVDYALAYPEGSSRLLEKIEEKAISASELSAAVRQQLLHSGDQSQRVRSHRLLAEDQESELQDVVNNYLANIPAMGDAQQGELHFRKFCAACHQPDQAGRSAGPNLKNLSDKSPKAIVTAVLDPNRAVDPQYRSYIISTVDGKTLSGAIAQEIGNSISLAQANGQFVTIGRTEIEELKSTGLSLMPEGLHRELNPAAIADLIEYLKQ